MKKILSIFLAVLMTFGSVAIALGGQPLVTAEAAQQTYTEGNFVYEITNTYGTTLYATITDYTDTEFTGEIVIPDTLGGYSVRYLAAEAFKGCQCTAVSIPASVTSIAPEAFAYDMPNMERFTVDESNTRIFSDDSGILYKVHSNPKNHKDIIAYPKNAPYTSVEFDRNTAIIGAFAFAEAKNLKSVVFAVGSLGTYYNIEKYAFYNAKSLETVDIGYGLQSIGDYAFEGCSSLTSLSLPKTLTGGGGIGWDPFKDTPFINNPESYDEDGVLYIGNHLLATLPEADKEYYAIKIGTNSVAGGAFRWDSLREVYLPASVEEICSNPFALCANVEKFTVDPTGKYDVNDYGALCYYGDIVAYPNGIYRTCYVVEEGNIEIMAYAFYQSPIKKFYLPANIDYKGIYYLALGGDSVTDIYFEGIEEDWIDDYLYVKKRYEKETTAEDVAEIHYETYSQDEHQVTVGSGMQVTCSCGYTDVYTPVSGNQAENGFVYHIVNGEAVIVSYLYKNSADALVIPENLGGCPVTEIDCEFTGCMFTSVHIPSTITKIREGAFAYALNNQAFTVAEGNEEFSATDGVLLGVMDYAIIAYPQNASATSYKIPNGIVGIMPYAFCGTKNLKTVTMPQYKLSGINYYAVGFIYDCAFLNSSVETVSIESENFLWMGNGAFKDSQLKEISFAFDKDIFGNNTDSEIDVEFNFGHEVFEGTSFLENAEYDEDGVFYHQNCLIATDGGEGKTNYSIKDGTTVVAGDAFKWSKLEEVYIPASVKCIGSSAFSEATSLKTITADSDNEYFSVDDYGVLYSKDKTKLVAYPVGREDICYVVPNGVTQIDNFAFNNVQILESVNLPLSVETIDEFAFGMNGSEYASEIHYEGTLDDWNKIKFSKLETDLVRFDTITKNYETYTGGSHTTSLSIKEPGCTVDGSKIFECSCGYIHAVKLDQNGHDYDEYIYKGEGVFARSCNVCNNVSEIKIVGISLDINELEILPDAQMKINATPKYYISNIKYDYTCEFDFASSDENVATVDESGNITAHNPGKATVSVTIRGTDITATCEVTVIANTYTAEWMVDGEVEVITAVKEGDKIETPDDPVKEGYVFAGWTPEIPDVMPAMPLQFTAVFNKFSKSEDYDVSATYIPGCFSEEVSLDVAEITGDREPGGVYMVEGEYYKQIGLYNIKAVNSNSEVIQPNEGYTVTVKMAIPEAYKNRTEFMVYHRFTGGGREQLSTENGTLRVENGYLIFEVSEFSEFEIFIPSASVKITHLPDKTTYNYNTDEIDLTGIRLRYTKADGTTKTITDTSLMTVKGFDGTKLGKQTVTVSYGQYSDTFEVEVVYSWWQWIVRILFLGFLWY